MTYSIDTYKDEALQRWVAGVIPADAVNPIVYGYGDTTEEAKADAQAEYNKICVNLPSVKDTKEDKDEDNRTDVIDEQARIDGIECDKAPHTTEPVAGRLTGNKQGFFNTLYGTAKDQHQLGYEIDPNSNYSVAQHASHLTMLLAGLIEKAKRKGLDGRLIAMANTDFERGFMALEKAINTNEG